MTSRPSVLLTDRAPASAAGQSQLTDLTELIESDPWSGSFAAFNMLIYSEPGEGKTPLVASIRDVPDLMPALLIDCDSGTLSARGFKGLSTVHLVKLARQLEVDEWAALEKIYAWLRFGSHGFVSVILDGGSDLERFCEITCIMLGQERKDESGKDHDPDFAELSDYRRLQGRMVRMYQRFRDLTTTDGRRMTFIATAHEGVRKDPGTGAMIIQPLYIGAAAVRVQSKFDIVARLTHDNKGTKVLVPSLQGRARGRDRSHTLGDRIDDPTMAIVYERLSKFDSEGAGTKEGASGASS